LEVLVLTGPEKAVLFLLALDEEVARPIVAELGEAELLKLRSVASTMHQVPADAIDETFRDFVERARRAVAVPRGGLPYLRRLSAGALGEDRARALFEDGGPHPIARLEHAPADAVGALLADEPPQVAAAILSRLSPAVAAAVLATMDAERQCAVVGHVGRMTEIPAPVLEDMASAIAAALPNADASTLVSVDGVARAAEILNACGKSASSAILTALGDRDAELATQVRQAMFTFDDLVHVDPRAMRELLREVPVDRLTVALKGASDEVTQAVFAGLSSRAAELIRDDLEVLGNLRRSEIEKARAEVVQVALRLDAEGKLSLGREDDV
jgi:flagellar motor switch protein FliG